MFHPSHCRYSYAGPGSIAIQERFVISWGHYLASKKNIIYASIDGRGSARQGETRMHEVYKHLGTIEVADQLAVVRYLKSMLHFIEEDHVALQGWSYGGYVTALALAQDSETDPVFCCGISIAPASNWLYYGRLLRHCTGTYKDDELEAWVIFTYDAIPASSTYLISVCLRPCWFE